jgi:hypothetical protein
MISTVKKQINEFGIVTDGNEIIIEQDKELQAPADLCLLTGTKKHRIECIENEETKSNASSDMFIH